MKEEKSNSISLSDTIKKKKQQYIIITDGKRKKKQGYIIITDGKRKKKRQYIIITHGKRKKKWQYIITIDRRRKKKWQYIIIIDGRRKKKWQHIITDSRRKKRWLYHYHRRWKEETATVYHYHRWHTCQTLFWTSFFPPTLMTVTVKLTLAITCQGLAQPTTLHSIQHPEILDKARNWAPNIQHILKCCPTVSALSCKNHLPTPWTYLSKLPNIQCSNYAKHGQIQGDGRKFLDCFKSYFGSQISSQSLNEVHIYWLQPKSATKGDFFHTFFFLNRFWL